MKKFTLLSILAILVAITYFVVKVNAQSTTASGIMQINYNDHIDQLNIANSNGESYIVKLPRDRNDEDAAETKRIPLTDVLKKINEFKQQGWKISQFTSVPYYSISVTNSTSTIFTQFYWILEK